MTARHLLQQPDDPGVHHESVHGPVRFVPQGFDREIAAIGDNPVGAVEPINWGKMKRWSYRTSLFEGPLQFKADTLIKARIALLHRIADWHDLAGPMYAEHARLIRLQADELST